MQGSSIAEYSQKCTSPPPPHGANQNKSAAKRPRAIFIQINYCPLWQRRARRAESKSPPGAFRTDIFCIEDVDGAPVYH